MKQFIKYWNRYVVSTTTTPYHYNTIPLYNTVQHPLNREFPSKLLIHSSCNIVSAIVIIIYISTGSFIFRLSSNPHRTLKFSTSTQCSGLGHCHENWIIPLH